MIISLSGKAGVGKDSVAIMIQGLELSLDRDQVIHAVRQQQQFKESSWQIKRFADKLKDITCMLIGCTREKLEDREFKEKPLGEEWNYFEAFSNGKRIIYANKKDFPYDASHFTEKQMTPRKLMQLLGTECGRKIIHPNIWVNTLFADYNMEHEYEFRRGVKIPDAKNFNYPNWIIPDCRFKNEADAIKEKGGVLIRINRKKIPKIGEEVEIIELDNYTKEFRSKFNLPIRGIVKEVYDPEILVSIDGCEENIDLYEWQYKILTDNHLSETALDNYEDFDYVINNNGSLEDLLTKVKQLNLPL